MMQINRRHTLGLIGAAGGSLVLPRLAFGQASRPSITIAVQKITNNGTLDRLERAVECG